MKKTILFMSAVAMLAAVSCNKAEIDNSSAEVETPSANNLVEFVAYTDVETKTSLNGLATEWEGGDMIDINGITFETSDVGSKATFTADEKPEAPYHAGYPCYLVYDNEEQVEGKLGFNFDNSFVLDAGTLCDDVLAVAYSESEPSLQFKNVVSLLKFRVPEFIEDITEIRISTTETLAGDIYVNYNDATWTIDEDRESFNEIVITPGSNKFEHGEDIYYYVPVLPGEKTNLTVRINGYIAATGKTIEFKRNFIHNLGTLPAPVESDVKIKGDIQGGNSWNTEIALYKDLNGLALRKNVSGKDKEFKFINNNAWLGGPFAEKDKWCIALDWSNLKLPMDNCDIYFDTNTSFFSIVSSGSPAPSVQYIYLKPNTNWKSDGARFAVAFLNSDKSITYWYSMGYNKTNDVYECIVPGGFKYMIFCRMDGGKTDNNWDNKWNQTTDLEIPTNGNNHYTVKEGTWDKGGGTWSKK